MPRHREHRRRKDEDHVDGKRRHGNRRGPVLWSAHPDEAQNHENGSDPDNEEGQPLHTDEACHDSARTRPAVSPTLRSGHLGRRPKSPVQLRFPDGSTAPSPAPAAPGRRPSRHAEVTMELVTSAEEHHVAALLEQAVADQELAVFRVGGPLVARTHRRRSREPSRRGCAPEIIGVAADLDMEFAVFKGLAIGDQFYDDPWRQTCCRPRRVRRPRVADRLGELVAPSADPTQRCSHRGDGRIGSSLRDQPAMSAEPWWTSIGIP